MQIDKIVIGSTELYLAKAFYNGLLGFSVLDETAAQLSVSIGRSVLCFQKQDTPAFYHFAVLIPSNQIHQALNWMATKREILPFTEHNLIADFKNWNAEAFYFHDQQQNIVEFIVHHDLENRASMPFSADAVLGICELGIPVLSVPFACAHLNQHYGIPYYTKGPHLADFAVMGDEEGLLILTTIGRGWLPTQRPAENHNWQLQLTHQDQLLHLNQVLFLER